MALSGLKKDDEALRALERALRINPDYADAKKARNSISSKIGIDLDEEEEKMEEEKPKVSRSVWTRKEPTSEIMKKNWGKGREQKENIIKKDAGRGREKRNDFHFCIVV